MGGKSQIISKLYSFAIEIYFKNKLPALQNDRLSCLYYQLKQSIWWSSHQLLGKPDLLHKQGKIIWQVYVLFSAVTKLYNVTADSHSPEKLTAPLFGIYGKDREIKKIKKRAVTHLVSFSLVTITLAFFKITRHKQPLLGVKTQNISCFSNRFS